MKHFIIFSVLLLAQTVPSSAQNINFGLKVGSLSPKFAFHWEGSVTNNSHTRTGYTHNIYAEGRVYKRFYLGAEMGVGAYEGFVDIKYTESGDRIGSVAGARVSYFGWYQQDQYYFTLNPQIKLGKSEWFSVGGGLGIYRNFINRFSNGFRMVFSSKYNSFDELAGTDLYSPNSVAGGYLNATFNPRISKHIGALLDMRYVMNAPSTGQTTLVRPALSFNSLSVLVGLSFHL